MTTATRRLSRSINDRMIAGVLGGIAHRLGWNASWLRLIYVVLTLGSFGLPGGLLYLLAWLLIPDEAD